MKHTYPPPFSTYREVTASRTFNTEYSNTTGKLMMVIVTCQFTVVNAGDWVLVQGQSPTGTTLIQAGYQDALGDERMDIPIIFVVNPDATYKVNKAFGGNGTVTDSYWVEVY